MRLGHRDLSSEDAKGEVGRAAARDQTGRPLELDVRSPCKHDTGRLTAADALQLPEPAEDEIEDGVLAELFELRRRQRSVPSPRGYGYPMGMREGLWPAVAVQPRPTAPQAERYVRSYLIMRVAVGALGIALPLVLVLGEPLLFNGQPFPRGSLSAYYYSGVREIFVGALCAIGVFLITYKVAERSRENRLSTVAGVAVIIVALFPTGRPGNGTTVTPLQALLGEPIVELVHFGAAAVFIASLAVISYYFAKPAPKRGSLPQSFWSRYHFVCAGLIIAALILAAVAGITSWPDKGLLIAEAVAVWAFGASWLMKGLEIDVLLSRHKAVGDIG